MSRPFPFFEQHRFDSDNNDQTPPTMPLNQANDLDGDDSDNDPLWLIESSRVEDLSGNGGTNNSNSLRVEGEAAIQNGAYPPSPSTQQQQHGSENAATTAAAAAAAIHTETCWQTISTTPMTSRPHFRARSRSFNENDNDDNGNDEPPLYPMRRIRSRSLGSSPAPPSAKERYLRRSQTDSNSSGSSSSNNKDKHCRNAGRCSAGLGQWQDLWIPNTTPQTECIAKPRPVSPRISEDNGFYDPEPYSDDDDNEVGDTPDKDRENGRARFRKRQASTSSRNSRCRRSQQEPSPPASSAANPFWISLMYGMINATIVLPVLMSFASIIYREQAFQPYMARLTKLTLLSGIVHQFTFSTFSSLPFCVGQVQDAGLIFLSSMASFVVQYCNEKQLSDNVLLATTTVCLSLGTAVLGLGLLVIGQCGLAQYVQMLPTSVVGGYLAYIGWFCGMAGVGLMAGESEVTWAVVMEAWYLILPGVLGGIGIYVMVRWLRHMAVLPCCIMALLVAFYLALWITGSSVEQVTSEGWIRESSSSTGGVEEEPPKWNETWDYLQFDLVEWRVLPHLILTELSMIFVVAMSSSLDVAAIELELKRPLNYNGELKMVGLSNLISGVTFGYTGSYIFSQSIFSLRAGITSRSAGYVLASVQLAFFLLPFPVLSYVPNFFFGSLLCMICVDLLYEWLWDVRHKVTPVEYIICLSTFGLIQLTGVEFGILLGVVVYLICYKIGLSVGEPKTLATGEEVANHAHQTREKTDYGTAILLDAGEGETMNNYGSI